MPTSLTLQATHTNPLEWLWVAGAVAIVLAASSWLALAARPKGQLSPLALFRHAGSRLEALTGLPAWAAAGVLLQTWAMLVAGVGLYWDVAWHIDLGRDTELFTPPHVLVLTGIAGFAVAGAVSALYATWARAEGTWRLGRLRVPRGAAALLLIGGTAGAGFPLDELWHATYGIDVTMWSPTHLMMIGAGVMSPFAAWLLLGEAAPQARRPRVRTAMHVLLAVSCLLAVSVLQLEFDDGVPQWQALFQPVLIAVAAGFGLVAARVAAGRGGALAAAVIFLVARAAVGVIAGPVLGHVTAHFPLYLGIAVCVEVGFAIAARRGVWRAALLAGVLVATFGLASEWGWSHVFGREPWQASMLASMWLPALAAVGAAILGGAFALAVTGSRARLPRALPAAAALAVAAGLLVPLPRDGVAVVASVHTAPAGPRQLAVDRYGQASMFQMVRVEVDVSPAESALLRDSDWFWVNSWQGGGRLGQPLLEVAPGRWQAPRPVPTGAAWKTIVLLANRDVVAALPVALPADPTVGVEAVPLQPVRSAEFLPASRYLMRESHSGAQWPAILAYAAWLTMIAAWLITITAGVAGLRRQHNAAPRRAFGSRLRGARHARSRATAHAPR